MAGSAIVHPSSDDFEELAKAFSGMGTLGIEEKSIINIMGNWDAKKRQLFRRATPHHFDQDRHFEWWHKDGLHKFEKEYARFPVAATLWAMDHAERDARCVHEVLTKGSPLVMLLEVACSRTSDELLKARQAYHSLFKHSMEEHVPSEKHRSFLVALLSAYRYEGPEVDEDLAKKEAKILHDAINKDPFNDDEFVFIISTRSKQQLKATFNSYHSIHGKTIYEDIGKEECLRAAILCLCFPAMHYSETLKRAIKDGVHEEAITRVIVTRAEIDMKEIKEEYLKETKYHLEDDITKRTRGNYRDFLLTLLGRV